jgi:hypothetical protein
MVDRTLRGTVAVVGVGETPYYKRGESPDAEFKLALQAIVAACADAGISPHDVDGFSSFSNDRSDASRLAAALGIHDLRLANMQWGGGGGGGSGAIQCCRGDCHGRAECVVFRALAQGSSRFGQGSRRAIAGETCVPYGLMSPVILMVQRFAPGVEQALRAYRASYARPANRVPSCRGGRSTRITTHHGGSSSHSSL